MAKKARLVVEDVLATDDGQIITTDNGEPLLGRCAYNLTPGNLAVLETEQIPLNGAKMAIEREDGTMQEIDARQIWLEETIENDKTEIVIDWLDEFVHYWKDNPDAYEAFKKLLALVDPNKASAFYDEILKELSKRGFDTKLEIIDEPKTKRPRRKPIIQPTKIVSPKSIVSKTIFKSELTQSDVFPVLATTTKQGKFGAVVKFDYTAIERDRCIRIDGTLDEYKQLVHDAVCTLKLAGNQIFESRDINRVMKRNPNAKLTDTEAVEIAEAMNAMGNVDVTIISDPDGLEEKLRRIWDENHMALQPERKIKKYRNLSKFYKDKLLSFAAEGNITAKVLRTIDGERKIVDATVPTIWKMKNLPGEENSMPILYQYANAKKQIATTPIKELNPTAYTALPSKLKRERKTDLLDDRLRELIETMKHAHKISRDILYEPLYKLDGIEDAADGSTKTKKARTRAKVKKILEGYKKSGFIVDFKENSKKVGRAIMAYSVTIILGDEAQREAKKKAKRKA